MIPWQLLDSAQIPGEIRAIRLYKRAAEFSIRVGNAELMNSRMHGSGKTGDTSQIFHFLTHAVVMPIISSAS